MLGEQLDALDRLLFTTVTQSSIFDAVTHNKPTCVTPLHRRLYNQNLINISQIVKPCYTFLFRVQGWCRGPPAHQGRPLEGRRTWLENWLLFFLTD